MAALNLIEDNWSLVYSESKTAQAVPERLQEYYPIPRFSLPTVFSSRVLAVYVGVAESELGYRQKWGGKAFQKIHTAITVGGNYDSIVTTRDIWINQPTILFLSDLASQFVVDIEISYKIRDCVVEVHEYTGDINNIYDSDLAMIKADLAMIKSSLLIGN